MKKIRERLLETHRRLLIDAIADMLATFDTKCDPVTLSDISHKCPDLYRALRWAMFVVRCVEEDITGEGVND